MLNICGKLHPLVRIFLFRGNILFYEELVKGRDDFGNFKLFLIVFRVDKKVNKYSPFICFKSNDEVSENIVIYFLKWKMKFGPSASRIYFSFRRSLRMLY